MRGGAMKRLALTVCATDPWRQRGVFHLVSGERTDTSGAGKTVPEIVVLPPLRLAEADVAVVVAERVDAKTNEMLAKIAKFGRARTVLVLNELEGLDVPSAVRYRVITVLPAAGLTGEELRQAVRSAATGPLPPEEETVRLVEQLDRIQRGLLQPGGENAPQLTPRERALLRLLAEGCDTAEIAAKLCYSERTVKNIVHGLLERLNLRNRTHAVAYAMRAGVL